MKRVTTKILKLSTSLILATGLSLVSVGSSFGLEVLTSGDSITQGLGRTAAGQEFGVTSPVNGAANIGGYQPVLNQQLDAAVEPSTIYNWGVAGDRSFHGVSRIGGVLNSRPADYILIMYGANDLYQGLSSSATQANMDNMISQSFAREVTPIIAEITPNTSNGNFDAAIAFDYNPRLHALAAVREIEIAPMYQALRGLWQVVPYTSGDGLHLNGTGYNVMTTQWFDRIASIEQANNAIDAAAVTAALKLLLSK